MSTLLQPGCTQSQEEIQQEEKAKSTTPGHEDDQAHLATKSETSLNRVRLIALNCVVKMDKSWIFFTKFLAKM